MMLAARGVDVRLGGRLVLRGVDAAVRPGRVTVILGPNGAGKSTLLGVLAGARAPNAGAATLDGAPLATLDRRARARAVGLLPQRLEAHWNLRVDALAALGRYPWTGRWGMAAHDHAAVAAGLRLADAMHLAERPVGALSGGEAARAHLARLLAGEHRYLLADEPLRALDPAHQLAVLEVFRRAADAGAGVALVLHDLGLAARIADNAVLLADGAVAASGPAGEVLTPERLGALFGVQVERTAGGGLAVR
jgi:iron complex transport system ATP-binding protein